MDIVKTINHVKVEPVLVDDNGVTRSDVITGAEVFVSATEGEFENSMRTTLPLDASDLSDFVSFSAMNNELVIGWLNNQIEPIILALENAVMAKANQTFQIRILE